MDHAFNFDRSAATQIVTATRRVLSGDVGSNPQRRVPHTFKKNLRACYTGGSGLGNITSVSAGSPDVLDLDETTIVNAPIYTRSGGVITIKNRRGTRYFLLGQASFSLSGSATRGTIFLGIFQDPTGTPALISNPMNADLQNFNVLDADETTTRNIGPQETGLGVSGCYVIDESGILTKDKFALGAWKANVEGTPTMNAVFATFHIIEMV